MDETTLPPVRDDRPYDVAVLGAGLTGSALAAVLARAGRRVLLLDPGGHPRFGVEEIVTPYTAVLLRTLAARYRVPEIGHLAEAAATHRHVTRRAGVGRTLGFLHHRPGRRPDPADILQISSPRAVPAEPTLYRQDTDSYLFHAAVRYGADTRQHVRLTGLDVDDTGVRLDTAAGERFHAAFVVDASGGGPAFAAATGTTAGADRAPHSWSLHTHAVGVASIRKLTGSARAFGAPGRWDDGPTYHVFDGGYAWRVPFGNHRSGTNLVSSIGVTVDARRYPVPDGEPPEALWRRLTGPYPMVAGQFAGASPVQPWTVVTHRRAAADGTAGRRWCTLPADPPGYFLSRGLTDGLSAVNLLAGLLIDAGPDGLDRGAVAAVGAVHAGLREGAETLASTTLAATRDPLLWKAVLRVWEVGLLFGTLQAQRAWHALTRGDAGPVRELAASGDAGSPYPGDAAFRRLLDRVAAICAEVRDGAGPTDAGRRIFTLLRGSEIVPAGFGFTDPASRFYYPSPPRLLRLGLWSLRSAPGDTGAVVRGGLRAFVTPPSRAGAAPVAAVRTTPLSPTEGARS